MSAPVADFNVLRGQLSAAVRGKRPEDEARIRSELAKGNFYLMWEKWVSHHNASLTEADRAELISFLTEGGAK